MDINEHVSEMNERLIALEHGHTRVNERINDVAGLSSRLDEMMRPSVAKVASWILAFIFAMGVPIAHSLVQLGKYPDAETFVKREAEYAAVQKTLEDRVQKLEVSRAEQEVRLRTIVDTLDRLESKLDSALRRQR